VRLARVVSTIALVGCVGVAVACGDDSVAPTGQDAGLCASGCACDFMAAPSDYATGHCPLPADAFECAGARPECGLGHAECVCVPDACSAYPAVAWSCVGSDGGADAAPSGDAAADGTEDSAAPLDAPSDVVTDAPSD